MTNKSEYPTPPVIREFCKPIPPEAFKAAVKGFEEMTRRMRIDWLEKPNRHITIYESSKYNCQE